ncbi:UDP-N-acetylmuramate dehydrogenase [Pullulanibacillus pueri]|uniref:UDP-N-acetylenolpyruvoylglucosamine reductase n=1 Tax=Pullulanibacillus pueri TaxID=1437324 RepID=A0A8J3ELV1_9BACL|nr:UDP-N-acetylmuramate dehydrogenase [Pullulanibacillus pueri]MBM7681238.1 UDP-N-acetylmuramate dehydrogenase [Pullulanibacillus pueri]GGH77927.1 UDP-N-acetylenolpyruvoylglucosamine reductase [Pullulanibacillus pueri]
MEKQEVFRHLNTQLKNSEIKQDEFLKDYTYTKIGGQADFLIFPKNYEDIQTVVAFAKNNEIPLTIMGNGSNVLIRDGGIRGLVLNLTQLKNIESDGHYITAQSGARIIDASRFALEKSLTGLEFACGIPGSVGGALYMNAGAYGGEVSDVLESALIIDEDGEISKVSAGQLELSYRTSSIQKRGLIVLEAHFHLEPGNGQEIKSKMDELTFLRESKQPLEYPSCGSVFKRPPGYYAGKLIQDSGLQGYRVGGAEVSKKHAGFIVNVNQATAKDYLSVIEHVQESVKDHFGVTLETEVKIIGEEPRE